MRGYPIEARSFRSIDAWLEALTQGRLTAKAAREPRGSQLLKKLERRQRYG
ncbi:hypothetical protein BH24GEM1_BH24GEM1_15610 [soil metagenome]